MMDNHDDPQQHIENLVTRVIKEGGILKFSNGKIEKTVVVFE